MVSDHQGNTGASRGAVLIHWLLWLTLLLLVACTSQRPVPPDAELLVATAALTEFVGEPDSVSLLSLYRSLDGKTQGFPDSAAWTAATDGFGLQRVRYPTLVARYWSANRRSRRLTTPLQVPGWTVQLVEEPARAGTNSFETVHHVSRVGFGASGDSALVAVDAICGPLCGRSVLQLFVRRAGEWTLASTLQRLQY